VAREPTWYVGNQTPPITQTLLDSSGAAINLTGATVRFRMRPVGFATLTVDQPATIVNAAAGQVSYAWATPDVAAAGQFLTWWQITLAAKTQDVGETLIQILPHGLTPQLYVEPEQLKELISMDGTTYADDAVLAACHAASRGVDLTCKRRFWLDADANQVRTYTPEALRLLEIDDLVTLTSVALDRSGSGSYSESWTVGTDFILEPQNAPKDVPPSPYEWLRVRLLRGRWLPLGIEASVQITGKFGWTLVPEEIQTCTGILASKMLRRVREAPFGIVAVGGMDTGIAARIAKTDPDVAPILESYTRGVPWQ
jgi:hypothetical protein